MIVQVFHALDSRSESVDEEDDELEDEEDEEELEDELLLLVLTTSVSLTSSETALGVSTDMGSVSVA